MKKFLFFLPFLFAGCSVVPAGHVGIKVYLLGTSKGVDSEELPVGRYHIGFNEELYLFPTFKQNYVWTQDPQEGSPNDESFTFQTKEGMEVGADIGITYRLAPEKISNVFQKYRRGINEITDVFLRNQVRDALNSAASRMPVESVYGEGKEELIRVVTESVKKQVEEEGIIIEQIYLIGKFRLPDAVTVALNEKITATQRALTRENELAESVAEAKKKIEQARGEAESIRLRAEAEAKANEIVSNSLTSVLIQYEKIKKWNGILPTTMAGNGDPLLMIGK